MLVAIDIGNTNTVIAVYTNETLTDTFRLYTDRNKTADEYGIVLTQLLNSAKIPLHNIKGIIISSVVPTLTEILSKMCNTLFHLNPIIVGVNSKINMNIIYDNPQNLGADRIVNAVSAYKKYNAPAIIADLGTALTIDVVDKNGNFIGGIITAGIKTTAEALIANTSKLPKISISKPETAIGKSTDGCIQSGLYYGFIGLVDGIIEKFLEELNEEKENIKIIGTGGFSNILKESKYVKIIDEQLTLDGLKFIYKQNIDKTES